MDRRLSRSATDARAQVPLHENALNRLADLLFAADELLELVRAPEAKTLHWTEPHLRNVYDEVNGLMKKLAD